MFLGSLLIVATSYLHNMQSIDTQACRLCTCTRATQTRTSWLSPRLSKTQDFDPVHTLPRWHAIRGWSPLNDEDFVATVRYRFLSFFTVKGRHRDVWSLWHSWRHCPSILCHGPLDQENGRGLQIRDETVLLRLPSTLRLKSSSVLTNK